ncbi:YeaC family protein [Teredinibacter franksiae]|uniref:YeaC family protein n=1 Tax=Teredinibacter franksiae TaxID=2761453 RepID=UPI00162A473F|nr:DUF1315 family protein [Teredinibacter franksiae]
MNIESILKSMTPEIYRRFKTAVEVRKWPDGNALTQSQIETCMEAIIAYEHRYISETERTGFMPTKETPCEDKHEHSPDEETELKWTGK